MIWSNRRGRVGRWLWSVVLIGAVLAVVAGGPSAAQSAPTGHQRGQARTAQQTQPAIDAQANPAAAAAALDAGTCGTCITWQTGTAPGGCAGGDPAPAAPVQSAPCVPATNNTAHYAITEGWSTPAVFGDVLYNCSANQPAETDTGTSDARADSFSLSEKVTLSISVKVPDVVSLNSEVSAFSKQAISSADTVLVNTGVTVDPGWKGWTTTQVKTEMIPGSASVTDPVRNIITPVQGLNVTFPGYKLNPAENETSFTGHEFPMTDAEMLTICGAGPVNSARRGIRVVGAGVSARRPSSFALRLCGRTGPCRSREVTGSLPPSRIRQAAARLTRAGHTYGRGTYTHGNTQVRMSRALRPGKYRLTLTEPSQRVGARALHAIVTSLPVTVS